MHKLFSDIHLRISVLSEAQIIVLVAKIVEIESQRAQNELSVLKCQVICEEEKIIFFSGEFVLYEKRAIIEDQKCSRTDEQGCYQKLPIQFFFLCQIFFHHVNIDIVIMVFGQVPISIK